MSAAEHELEVPIPVKTVVCPVCNQTFSPEARRAEVRAGREAQRAARRAAAPPARPQPIAKDPTANLLWFGRVGFPEETKP